MCIVLRVAGTITCAVWYESETGETGVTLILCRKMLYCINTWEISIIFNVGLSVKYLPVLLQHSFSGSCCIYSIWTTAQNQNHTFFLYVFHVYVMYVWVAITQIHSYSLVCGGGVYTVNATQAQTFTDNKPLRGAKTITNTNAAPRIKNGLACAVRWRLREIKQHYSGPLDWQHAQQALIDCDHSILLITRNSF
jgi:hypothetical protein